MKKTDLTDITKLCVDARAEEMVHVIQEFGTYVLDMLKALGMLKKKPDQDVHFLAAAHALADENGVEKAITPRGHTYIFTHSGETFYIIVEIKENRILLAQESVLRGPLH